jgi:hypothetical protein
MTEHLDHEKNRAEPERESTNMRNGARSKTVVSDAAGEVQPLSVRVESRTGRILAISNFGGDQSLHTQIGNIHVGSTLRTIAYRIPRLPDR